MKFVDLNVVKREKGQKAAKALRAEGYVPGIFYAQGKENFDFAVKVIDLRPVVYTAHKPIVKLLMEGSSTPIDCVLKDITFDPVTEQIMHIDMLGLIEGHPVTVELPLILVGTPAGAKIGGKLNQVINKVKLTTTPDLLPDSIEVDVSHLNIGNQIQIKDIKKEGWKFALQDGALLCTVEATRV